jgi:hypothetical protein
MAPWSPDRQPRGLFWTPGSEQLSILSRPVMDTGHAYYSDWVAAPGSAATFVLEVLAIGPNIELTIEVQTKDLDETEAQTVSIDGLQPVPTVGVMAANGTGIKQLVRVKYTVSGTGSLESVHFRWLSIAWRP